MGEKVRSKISPNQLGQKGVAFGRLRVAAGQGRMPHLTNADLSKVQIRPQHRCCGPV